MSKQVAFAVIALVFTLAVPPVAGQTQIYDLPIADTPLRVAGLGDLDGDGCDEFLARDTVYSGRDGQVLFGNSSLAQQTVCGLGDTNHDGFGDFAVGGNGAIAVISGRDASLRWTAVAPPGHRLGDEIARVGDVDGDGAADLLTSDSRAFQPGASEVRLYSGADGSVLLVVPLNGAGPGGFAPFIAGTGDMDGDGVADFAAMDAPGGAAPLRAFSGASGALLFTLAPPAGTTFGRVAAGCDLDADGRGDLLVHVGNGLGRIDAISGASGLPQYSVWPAAGGAFLSGWLAVLGDVNGDGRSDFVTLDGCLAAPCVFSIRSGAGGSVFLTVTDATLGLAPAPSGLPAVTAMASAGDVLPDGISDLAFGVLHSYFPASGSVRVVSLAPLPAASATPFGAGCGGAGANLAMEPPVLGSQPWLAVWNVEPGAEGVVFGGAAASPSIALGGGCTVEIDPITIYPLTGFTTSPAGFWSFQVPVMRDLRFSGLSLRIQAAVAPASGPLQLTNAVDLVFGF